MGMGLSLGCYQSYEQRHYLSCEQRSGLKHLLLLEQKLRHPEYPNSVKGLEGMQVAHQILQERGASGILIGGLAEAVWNQRRKPEDLYKHKDVDVAVLDDSSGLGEKFEGGVDWWVPQSGRITISSSISSLEGLQKRWYENANGVVLSFGLNRRYNLEPGLYIPDSEWVVDMREYEARANVDDRMVKVEFDENVFEKFKEKIRERVKTRLPKFVLGAFRGHVLSPRYEKNYSKMSAVDLESFDYETISAIRGFESEGEGCKR